MARPSRCRRVCTEPAYDGFMPIGIPCGEIMILTVDEYEVIRLIDLEKLTHEQCGQQMDISRTTVTEIYESARAKIADSIVYGKPLRIAGGHYRLCDGSVSCCQKTCAKTGRTALEQPVQQKGANQMRIAVTYENGEEVSREVINNSTYQTSDVTVKVGTKSDNAEATKLVEEAIATQDQEKINAAISKASALK